MRKYTKLPFKLLLAMMFTIVLTISVGLSIWLITDRVEIKPELEAEKVITKYLNGQSATYEKNTIFLPSSEELGWDKESADLIYYFKLKTDSGGNDVEDTGYVKVTDKVGPTNAGTYNIKVEYILTPDSNPNDDINDSEIVTEEVTFTIYKATIDMSGISFVGEELIYDKEKHNITISGTLPKDKNGNTVITDVVYTCNNKTFNGATNAGIYNVTASFEYDTYNYETVAPKEATLKINAKSINLFDLSFKDNSNNTFYTGTKFDDVTDSLIIIDDDGEKLLLNDDYTVSYGNIVNLVAGDYTITVTGVNNYEGKLIGNFIIKDKPINLIVTKKDTSSNFEKLTYNGLIQGPSVIVTNDEGTIIEDAVLTYTINDATVEPKYVGTYNNIIVTASKTGYNDGSSVPIILQIEAAPITLQWSNTKSFVYNQKSQRPDYDSVSFFEGDDCTLTNPEGAINYGQHSVTVSLSGKDAGNYTITNPTCTYNITKRPISLINNEYEIDYESSSRTWASIQSIASGKLKFNDVLPGDSLVATVVGMHNGVYKYGTIANLESLETTTNVVGSAYQATVLIDNNNYVLTTNTFILKYNTVRIDSDYYTIEDAIAKSGTMHLVGDDNNYVLTSFSKILSSRTYKMQGSKLVVPYSSSLTSDYKCEYQASENGVYSSLYIPTGITINLSNFSDIIVGGILDQVGLVKKRGVIVNDGTINLDANCNLKSYGFTKGQGQVNASNGSSIIDVFYIPDWPGADEAIDLQKNNAFPVKQWSCHNVSCVAKIENGAIYEAISYVVMISGVIKYEIKDIVIIGNETTNNYLFKPINSGEDDYVLKSAIIANDSIETSNQDVKQIDNIEINGDYIDGNVKVTVKYIMTYEITTSTSMCVVINYFNINVSEGSLLSLSNSSYVFEQASVLTVENGATLSIHGSAYVALMNDSVMHLEGTMNGSGTFGGKIESNTVGAMSTISNYNPSNIILKTGSTTYNTFQASTSAKIYRENEYIESGVMQSGSIYIYKTFENGNYFDESNEYSTFTVVYDTVGGENLSNLVIYDTTSSYIIDSTMLSIPTRKGYKFAGWYLDYEDGEYSNPFVEAEISNGATLKLYAKWDVVEYTIEYVVDFENTDVSDYVINNTTTFDANTEIINILSASSENLYFYGWYNDSEYSNSYYIGIGSLTFEDLLDIIPMNGTKIVLYGYFSSITYYNVDFITNCEIPLETLTLQSGSQLDLSTSLGIYKDGHEFVGWYYDETFTNPVNEILNVTQDLTLYAKWKILEYTVTFMSDGKVHKEEIVQYGSTVSKPSNPSKSGYKFVCWKTSSGVEYNFDAEVKSNLVLTAEFEKNSICVAEGTLITLANGTQKIIEDLRYDDILLAWDFEKGEYVNSKVLSIINHGVSENIVINLLFEDGNVLRIVGEHGLFDYTDNKWSYINDRNYSEYIGHYFVTESIKQQNIYETSKLVDAYITVENVGSYSLLTDKTINCYSNGVLTITPVLDWYGLFEYFEFGDDLKYNEELMSKDIEMYGLYSYDEWSEYISYDIFVGFNVQYLKISVAKGYITEEDMIEVFKLWKELDPDIHKK